MVFHQNFLFHEIFELSLSCALKPCFVFYADLFVKLFYIFLKWRKHSKAISTARFKFYWCRKFCYFCLSLSLCIWFLHFIVRRIGWAQRTIQFIHRLCEIGLERVKLYSLLHDSRNIGTKCVLEQFTSNVQDNFTYHIVLIPFCLLKLNIVPCTLSGHVSWLIYQISVIFMYVCPV